MTHYIWDTESDNVLMETDDMGAVTAEYTHEPGEFGELISQHRDGKTSVYHYDDQGSTRQLTDQNQIVTDTYTYTAFGEEVAKTGTTVNPYRYIGSRGYQYNQETGDFYIRARTYEPTIARWLSVDPLGYVDGLNLYQYVLNNPLIFSDPSGTCVCCKVKSFKVDPATFNKENCKAVQNKRTRQINFIYPFKVSVEFSNAGDGAYSCHCCSYRQEVRGFVRYRQDPGGKWTVGRENKKFEEDCITDSTGTKQCFGDRDATGRKNDVYSDDRKTGCSYSMFDKPGAYDLRPVILKARRANKKLRIEISLAFKLSIIDTCCKEPSKDDLKEVLYTVRCGVSV